MHPSTLLTDLLQEYYTAMSEGDLATLERLVAADALAIGTDPAEWLSGAELWKTFREQLDALGGSIPVVPGEPVAFQDGSTGWAADRPTFRLPGLGDIPFRLTVVFHERDGAWRIVHSHASVGVANPAAAA